VHLSIVNNGLSKIIKRLEDSSSSEVYYPVSSYNMICSLNNTNTASQLRKIIETIQPLAYFHKIRIIAHVYIKKID